MRRFLPLLVILALAAPAWALPWDAYYIHATAKTPAERGIAANLGMDIFAARPDGIVGIASQKQIEGLIEAGFDVAYLTLPEHAPGAAADFPPADSVYHNYDEMTALLQQIADDHPDIVQLYSIGKSLQNRELWTVKISMDVANDHSDTKGAFIVMGQHHAREHITREISLAFIQYLAETADVLYSTTRMLETTEVWVTPSVNPDGAAFDIATGSYQYQRKNLRDYPASCFGVDNNRNYGYMWGGDGSSPDECDETYHGPSAFSEPENQHVRDHVTAHSPYPERTVLLTYHNFAELVMYPWGYTYGSIPQADLPRHQQLAQSYANITGYTAQQSSDLYLTSGDTCDWSYGALGVTSFTVETSGWNNDFYIPGSHMQSVIDDNMPAALDMMAHVNPAKTTADLDRIKADVAAYKSWKATGRPVPATRAVRPDLACGMLSLSPQSDRLWGPAVLAAALLVPGLIFLIRRRNRR